MTDAERLTLVKSDLQMTTSANDILLEHLLQYGEQALRDEGLTLDLDSDLQSNLLTVQYAAYLFRKRASENTEMPRFLRYGINQMLWKQKGHTE